MPNSISIEDLHNRLRGQDVSVHSEFMGSVEGVCVGVYEYAGMPTIVVTRKDKGQTVESGIGLGPGVRVDTYPPTTE